MAALDPSQAQGQGYEPVQKNRFRLLIDNIPSYMIRSVKLPGIKNNIVDLPYLNQIRKVKGKTTYDDASVGLFMPIAPSGPQIMMDWIRLSHEAITGRDGYNDFYKKEIRIQLLGPPLDIIGEWVLKGAWVSQYDPGDFNYGEDGQIEPSITITVDWMELNF